VKLRLALGAVVALTFSSSLPAAEWPSWRGPGQDGVSAETGLVSTWAKTGENLLWRVGLTSRSTPAVFDGRVCTNGRTGEGDLRQEWVACFDAATGAKLWEHAFNVYHTAVPWNRVGWASVTGDPETGNLFVQGVGGTFLAFDRAGKIVWQRALVEEFGFFSGFGGRTQTPLVDEDRVIVPFVSGSWGDWGPPRHRLFAFDKRSGELQWVATPSNAPEDLNSQSTPAVVIVDGRRLLVAGYSDGWLYAVDARTGEKAWGFQVSKRSLNTSPVVAPDGTVYIAHSEENLDSAEMGRLVAIDPRGSGDVTKTHEKWRASIEAGFSSPAYANGKLYILDNSANLYQVDGGSGAIDWTLDLGTVGKASPVIADGKIWVTEVNGRFHIVEPGATAGKSLDVEHLTMPDGRDAEIYGSAAIGYGRVYFTSEEGLYCLGDKTKVAKVQPGPKTAPGPAQEPAAADAAVAKLLVVPAEVMLAPGGTARFRVLAFDAKSRPLGVREGTWSLEGLAAQVDAKGGLTVDAAKGTQQGKVKAAVGEVSATARVRVVAGPPLNEDFEAVALKGRPAYFLSGAVRFEVADLEGNKVLAKGPAPEGIHRHRTFLGLPTWSGYTIQADLMGVKTGRKVPDVGLINSGYTADLMGAQQQIQIRSWESELRATQNLPFAWETGVWYTMKLRVDQKGGKSVVQVKVWRKAESEPAEWTLVAEDPLPIPQGSPGLYGFTPSLAYYDNVQVTRN
jgi:outer membrane protein assembly factor BamB